jgi:hypothetical protein
MDLLSIERYLFGCVEPMVVVDSVSLEHRICEQPGQQLKLCEYLYVLVSYSVGRFRNMLAIEILYCSLRLFFSRATTLARLAVEDKRPYLPLRVRTSM